MMGYEQAPAGIVFLKHERDRQAEGPRGQDAGASANDGGFKLFPIFEQHTGIDPTKVNIKFIDPKLRETLLAKHDVDAIIGADLQHRLELKAKGVNVNDIIFFLYRDYGLDLYGNGVAASPALPQGASRRGEGLHPRHASRAFRTWSRTRPWPCR